jgi:hypothetical protein
MSEPDKDDEDWEAIANKPIEEVEAELEDMGVDLVAFEVRLRARIQATRSAARKVN